MRKILLWESLNRALHNDAGIHMYYHVIAESISRLLSRVLNEPCTIHYRLGLLVLQVVSYSFIHADLPNCWLGQAHFNCCWLKCTWILISISKYRSLFVTLEKSHSTYRSWFKIAEILIWSRGSLPLPENENYHKLH